MRFQFSEDQNYRGKGAIIAYRGHALCKGRIPLGFPGAKWGVYREDGTPVGSARDFQGAKSLADREVENCAKCDRKLTVRGDGTWVCPNARCVNAGIPVELAART